ncbi:pyruvate formate lyase family protein [Oscillospiraceae bacterium PP1C4]
MNMQQVYTPAELEEKAKALFAEERGITRLDGWFLAREIAEESMVQNSYLPHVLKTACALKEVAQRLPIFISENSVFAGTQRDAFAKSYALINPNFKVNTFNGYCDPTAVYNDIEPNDVFTEERIDKVRRATKQTAYVSSLQQVYAGAQKDTAEVVYFIEQVTGHLIPDFRTALQKGVAASMTEIAQKLSVTTSKEKQDQYKAMYITLECVLILAKRYADCAAKAKQAATGARKAQLELMEATLNKVPRQGAETLYEAIQSFILLWQMMCLEQAPNPFAFSVGNADRIFEPYRAKEDLSREEAAGLFKHFLVFFNVGDRSWAISQNILIGGKSTSDEDLTSLSSYALLDAYFAMNLPQPILSVKLHKNTPNELYRELGRFFFTPGCLTPSLFNDDALFEVLRSKGFAEEDLADYAIAGCQEPLIMGKDNGNTTNSWLNLAKILELALNDGCSLITNQKIGPSHRDFGIDGDARAVLQASKDLFYKYAEHYINHMVTAANGASNALSHLPVPFLSCFMGGIESGIDARCVTEQGTKYNGSGCLIHGLTVVADSFAAIEQLLLDRPEDSQRLLDALKTNFESDEELRQYLFSCEKFGNNQAKVDAQAAELAEKISDLIAGQKNELGNPFRPDWATPSTHLLYGYWVGATPDGRKAREMLNYGIDPLYGEAQSGLGLRVLSTQKLPYHKFSGGYASHLGLDPAYFRAESLEDKGLEFKNKIMTPLFFSMAEGKVAPFYLYLNITTPETLRKVLENPKKYAPSGVYIMRIHGTFVNFLDLSPEIQQDIIKRLDLKSTTC